MISVNDIAAHRQVFGSKTICYNDEIYSFGGRHCDKANSTIKKFNGERWMKLKRCPYSPRAGHSMDLYNGKIWIFGGSNATNYFSGFIIFDIERNAWRQVQSRYSPPARKGHATCVVGDVLYLYGGKSADANHGGVWVFFFRGLCWRRLNLDLKKLSFMNMIHIDNKLYTFGGMNTSVTKFPYVQVIDLQDLHVRKHPIPEKITRSCAELVPIPGENRWKWLWIGGYTELSDSITTIVDIPTLTFKTYDHYAGISPACCMLKDQIHIIGGANVGGLYTRIHRVIIFKSKSLKELTYDFLANHGIVDLENLKDQLIQK